MFQMELTENNAVFELVKLIDNKTPGMIDAFAKQSKRILSKYLDNTSTKRVNRLLTIVE